MMQRRPIELINNNQIRIHDKVFQIISSPLPGNMLNVSLEVTGDKDHGFGQFFDLSLLRNIRGSMIPEGFSLSIYEVKGSFKPINAVFVKNVPAGRNLGVLFDFAYKAWMLPVNIFDFSELMSRELRLSSGVHVSMDKSEYGISFFCYFPLGVSDDCFEKYRQVEKQIDDAYTKCVTSITAPSVSDQGYEDSAKWWLQHVVVPLVGSGTFAALVVWLMARVS